MFRLDGRGPRLATVRPTGRRCLQSYLTVTGNISLQTDCREAGELLLVADRRRRTHDDVGG